MSGPDDSASASQYAKFADPPDQYAVAAAASASAPAPVLLIPNYEYQVVLHTPSPPICDEKEKGASGGIFNPVLPHVESTRDRQGGPAMGGRGLPE